MKYARLQTCPTTHLEYGFLASELCDFVTFFAIGRPIEEHFPADPDMARCALDPEFPGIDMPDLVGNTRGVLVLSARALEAFSAAELDFGAHDVCPFTVMNHKGRVHGRDHRFVNPHGGFDVAHPSTDFKRYVKSQEIYGCKRWVLDTKKLEGKPDLFRSAQVYGHYFVSQRFVDVVEKEGLTNFEVIEVAHAAGPDPEDEATGDDSA